MHNKRRSRTNRRLSPDEKARVTKVQQWAARCETRGDFRKLLTLFRATVSYKCLVFGWGYHPDFVLAFWGNDEYPQDYIDFYVQEGVIRHDLVFREWLRTGKCQIWKDVYKRYEKEFDRRYARMTKRHGLANTITGGQISGVMASYFAVAMYSDRECRKYFAAFAACVPPLCEALKKVYPEPTLTSLQLRILSLLSLGYTQQETADKVRKSLAEVKFRLREIRQRLHARSTLNALRKAIVTGMLTHAPELRSLLGRLVIPKDIRREAGLKPGTPLEVQWRDGLIEIEPAPLPVKLRKRGRLLVAVPEKVVGPLSAETVERTRRNVRRDRARMSSGQ